MDNKKEMNTESKKLINTINQYLGTFTFIIILFLVVSYVANKYVPGLGLNFIYMFLPVGASFYKKPVLTNLFHSSLKIDDTNNNFYKTETLSSHNNQEEKTFYELLELGGTFSSIFFAKKEPTLSKIYVQDYNNLYWYQKIIFVIFGAIQILIGSITTILSSGAYLFSGKDGFFLNLPQMMVSSEEVRLSLENPVNSVEETKSNKLIIKSGWTKFDAFLNYIFFLPADKISFGTEYFLQDSPSRFLNKFVYFFFLTGISIFLGLIYGCIFTQSNNIVIYALAFIILYLVFGLSIFNKNKILDPLSSPYSLLHKIRKANKTPNINLNDLAQKITEVQQNITNTVKTYKKNAREIASQLGYNEISHAYYGGGGIKVKDKYLKNIEKIKASLRKL